MNINKLSCKFNDELLEQNYSEKKWNKLDKYIRNLLIIGHLIFLMVIIDDIKKLGFIPTYVVVIVATSIICYCLIAIKNLRKKYYQDYFGVIIPILMANGAFHYYFTGIKFPVGEAVLPILIFLIFILYPINFLKSIQAVVISILPFILLLFNQNNLDLGKIPYLIILPFGYGLFTKWNNEFSQRLDFVKTIELEKRRKHVESLKQKELDRKNIELENARQFQIQMLPSEIPKFLNLKISTYINTAEEVGGDYYDFFINEDKSELTIAIGDATGHGMVAGNIVSITKAGLNSINIALPTNQILEKLNNIIKLVGIGRNRMSLNLCRISNGKLELCSAGMPPSFLYNKEKNELIELMVSGLPTGSLKNINYKIENQSFNSGDKIIMMTDGLPEAENIDNEILGYNRIKETILNIINENNEKIKNSLIELEYDWLGNIKNQDDISFVIIEKE